MLKVVQGWCDDKGPSLDHITYNSWLFLVGGPKLYPLVLVRVLLHSIGTLQYQIRTVLGTVFNCFTRYAVVARRTGGRLRENIEDFYHQGAVYPAVSWNP